jgi:hypothetical protein
MREVLRIVERVDEETVDGTSNRDQRWAQMFIRCMWKNVTESGWGLRADVRETVPNRYGNMRDCTEQVWEHERLYRTGMGT